MKSLAFFGLIAGIFISQLSVANEHLSWKAKEAQKIINGDEKLHQKWIEGAGSDMFLKGALRAVKELEQLEATKDVTPAEALIIEMLSQKYNLGDRWKTKYKFIENAVWANNSIIDLNRVELGKVTFRQVQAGITIQYDISRGMNIEGQRSSSGRMADGLSPIGPDGKPILLCRMFNTEKASFFEITQSERKNFLKMTQSGMKTQDACLTYGSALSKYWKERLRTFYDSNNVIITYDSN